MPGEKTARDASAACRPRDESGSNRPRKEAEARPAATLTAGSAFSARLLTLSLLFFRKEFLSPHVECIFLPFIRATATILS